MSPSLDRIAAGTSVDGESVGRGTGCANARTSGSVGALGGNTQGHPARELPSECRTEASWATDCALRTRPHLSRVLAKRGASQTRIALRQNDDVAAEVSFTSCNWAKR